MYSGSHKRGQSCFELTLDTSLSSFFPPSRLCGSGGRVPYRRLCTMAQVPLNLRKFLPEANIARNSNLGLEHGVLQRGSNNSQHNNGNHLILSCSLWSSRATVRGAHSVFLRPIRLPEKHTASNQAATMGSVRRFKLQVVDSAQRHGFVFTHSEHVTHKRFDVSFSGCLCKAVISCTAECVYALK